MGFSVSSPDRPAGSGFFHPATPLAASLATVPGLSGGNPNLANEKADSFTYGVIVRPRFIPGLSVAVDYLSIKLTDPISSSLLNSSPNSVTPSNGTASAR